MFQQLTLLHLLHKEYNRQRSHLHRLHALKETLPDGYLSHRGEYDYRVVRVNGKRDQIPISLRLPNREQLIYDLKTKRYLSEALPVLESNCGQLESAISRFQIYDPFAIGSSLLPHYQEDYDCSALLLPGDCSPQRWAQMDYETNTAFLEARKHYSEGGLLTRSKAEVDIATMLERADLSFHYEPLIRVGSRTCAPDFCIVHPMHRLLIFWEHFGMMDNPGYAYEAMNKLAAYADSGYLLGMNLIMTFETKEHPLHFGHIRRYIDTYLSPHSSRFPI